MTLECMLGKSLTTKVTGGGKHSDTTGVILCRTNWLQLLPCSYLRGCNLQPDKCSKAELCPHFYIELRPQLACLGRTTSRTMTKTLLWRLWKYIVITILPLSECCLTIKCASNLSVDLPWKVFLFMQWVLKDTVLEFGPLWCHKGLSHLAYTSGII